MTEKIHKTVLDNGLKVIFEERPDRNTTAMLIGIGLGYNYETPENRGIFHILEHIIFTSGLKEDLSHSSSQKKIESMGGDNNASTYSTFMSFYATTINSSFNETLKVLTQTVFNPIFNSKDFELEKNAVIEETKGNYMDNLKGIAYVNLLKLMYKKHPEATSGCERIKDTKKTKENEIRKLHSQFFGPNNMVLSVVGGSKFQDKIKLIKESFQFEKKKKLKWPSIKEPKQNELREKIVEKDCTQLHLEVGVKTAGMQSEDYFPLYLIDSHLGLNQGNSVLPIEIRTKKGLAYQVYSQYFYRPDYGYTNIYAGVKNGKEKVVKDIILNEFEKMRNKPLSNDRLKTLKLMKTGYDTNMMEDNMTKADWLAYYNISEIPMTFNQYIEKIKAVTSKDIQEVARKYFVPENTCFSIVKPKK